MQVSRKTTAGLLIIARTNIFADERFRAPKDRQPALSLSHAEVFDRYMGFEGEAWPDSPDSWGFKLVDGLAPTSAYGLVEKYHRAVSERHRRCDLILLQFDDSRTPSDASVQHFQFRGYDYGSFVSEHNLYSIVLNEVIYGAYPELRQYATLLNNSLLLPSLAPIAEISRIRMELIEDGADLETEEPGEPWQPISIFSPPITSATNSGEA